MVAESCSCFATTVIQLLLDSESNLVYDVNSCLKITVETPSSETRSGGIAHNEKTVQFSVGSDSYSWSSSCCVCSVQLCEVMCRSKCEWNTSFASCPQKYDKTGQPSICMVNLYNMILVRAVSIVDNTFVNEFVKTDVVCAERLPADTVDYMVLQMLLYVCFSLYTAGQMAALSTCQHAAAVYSLHLPSACHCSRWGDVENCDAVRQLLLLHSSSKCKWCHQTQLSAHTNL